jgi:hypothetical protein
MLLESHASKTPRMWNNPDEMAGRFIPDCFWISTKISFEKTHNLTDKQLQIALNAAKGAEKPLVTFAGGMLHHIILDHRYSTMTQMVENWAYPLAVYLRKTFMSELDRQDWIPIERVMISDVAAAVIELSLANFPVPSIAQLAKLTAVLYDHRIMAFLGDLWDLSYENIYQINQDWNDFLVRILSQGVDGLLRFEMRLLWPQVVVSRLVQADLITYREAVRVKQRIIWNIDSVVLSMANAGRAFDHSHVKPLILENQSWKKLWTSIVRSNSLSRQKVGELSIAGD